MIGLWHIAFMGLVLWMLYEIEKDVGAAARKAREAQNKAIDDAIKALTTQANGG